MENFVSIYQNAISSDDCKYIIDNINSSNLLQGTMAGTVVNTEMKDLLVSPRFFSDISPTSIIIGNALKYCKDDYVKKHPQLNKIYKWEVDNAYNLQKYNSGQGYHISHCENPGGATLLRVLAWMIYLNDIEEGGETEFLYQSMRIKPVKNTALI